MQLPYVPYFYIIHHMPSDRLYVGSRYTPKKKTANPAEFWVPGGYFTSSERIKRLIKLDGVDSFKVIDIITEDEILFPFGWCSILEYETYILNLVDAKNNPKYINGHNNVFGLKQDFKFWENLTDAERSINGKEGAEACRKLKVNSFFDPEVRKISASLGGKVQGEINSESGHLSKISRGYWDAVNSGAIIRAKKMYYNNGIVDRLFEKDDDIPEGFVVGGMKRTRNKNKINSS